MKQIYDISNLKRYYLQEKLVLLGAHQVFREVPALIDSLLGIVVSESQVYRSVRAVNEIMEEPDLPSDELKQIQLQVDQQVYAMVDGSFLFTDNGWKEVKVGRVFTATPQTANALKWKMGQSEYTAPLEPDHFVE